MSEPTEEQEHRALLDRILRYQGFRGAALRGDVLNALFEDRDNQDGMTSDQLGLIVYKNRKIDKKQKKDDIPDKQRSMRVLCGEVRTNLSLYSATEEGMNQKWCCVLPEANKSIGYKLVFINQWELPDVSGAFWQAHVQSGRRPVVIYSEPLFFRDRTGNYVSRWFDVNLDDPTDDEAIALLRHKHPDVETKDLHASFLYVLSGEIVTRQTIREWFEDAASMRVPAHNGRRINSTLIATTSPILLGSPQSNRMMRHMFESANCKAASFCFDKDRFGVTLAAGLEKEQMEKLRELTGKAIPKKGDMHELHDNPNADGYVFGVVTRMHNPYGEGVVTLISSHNTRAVEQMARTLTSNKRLDRLQSSGWFKERPIPPFFQGLFAVRLGPVNVDAEAREPELITLRTYS